MEKGDSMEKKGLISAMIGYLHYVSNLRGFNLREVAPWFIYFCDCRYTREFGTSMSGLNWDEEELDNDFIDSELTLYETAGEESGYGIDVQDFFSEQECVILDQTIMPAYYAALAVPFSYDRHGSNCFDGDVFRGMTDEQVRSLPLLSREKPILRPIG